MVMPDDTYPAYGRPARMGVDGKRWWAGGAATAIVAALVALVALLIVTVALDIKPVAPSWLLGDGADWTLSTRFAVTAAVSALAATALLQLLVVTTPRPRAFFGWIVTLVTLAAAVTPLLSAPTRPGSSRRPSPSLRSAS